MHDFYCRRYQDMHYEVLKERVRYFKENDGEKKAMCEIMEKIREDGRLPGLFDERVSIHLNSDFPFYTY